MLVSGELSISDSSVFTDEDKKLFTKWYAKEKADRIAVAEKGNTLYPSQIVERIKFHEQRKKK